jgi:hypothetical protein
MPFCNWVVPLQVVNTGEGYWVVLDGDLDVSSRGVTLELCYT